MEDRDDDGAAMSIAGSPEFGDDEGDDVAGGFSFPVPPLHADACIVPVYPIFGRPMSPPAEEPGAPETETETATVRVPLGRLLLEERDFRARQRDGSSLVPSGRHTEEEEEDGALDGVPPESYCLWAPGQSSPRRCRKSGSTGSVLRWRRISDRLVGRSHSDGKEKFVFLNAVAEPQPRKDDANEGPAGGSSSSKGDGGWSYYGKGGGGSGGRRRSYLPYKQELVGLFANVSGLRRSYHPF